MSCGDNVLSMSYIVSPLRSVYSDLDLVVCTDSFFVILNATLFPITGCTIAHRQGLFVACFGTVAVKISQKAAINFSRHGNIVYVFVCNQFFYWNFFLNKFFVPCLLYCQKGQAINLTIYAGFLQLLFFTCYVRFHGWSRAQGNTVPIISAFHCL